MTMNYQAKLTPTGTEILKNAGVKNTAAPKLTVAPEEPTDKQKDTPLKIAIIGTAPSSRMLAPYQDPSWKIWGCSPGNMNVIPRADVWFELHGNLLWPECRSYGEPYINWLRQLNIPLYMQDQSLCQNALTFPKDEMVAKYGVYFFTSSFAWMMAFAIEQGAKEIGLFGVDMASKDEYILQRSGGHYFIQLAASKGIRVLLPNESDLMQPPPLYGYSEVTPFGRKVHVREQELRERIAQMRNERDKLIHSITYLEGALEDMDYVKQIWGGAQSVPLSTITKVP